jgi:hypothetical protein
MIADALSGGGTYLKWETPGTSYTGVITDVTMRQARKFESTDLDFWDDGTAKMQVVLTLATAYRDASNPEDDGTRQLSINLWSGQKKALVSACKAAGVAEPEVGQEFTASHVSGIGNAKAPRVFEYVLKAAPSGVAAQLDVAPDAAPAAAANPAETAKGLLAAGMSAEDVAAATGLPVTTIAALANLVAA